MQVCTGNRQSLQQKLGAFHGPVCLEITTMLRFRGRSSGFLLLESLKFVARSPLPHVQVNDSHCVHRIDVCSKWIFVCFDEEGSEEKCEFRGTQRLELMKNEVENNSLSQSKSGPRDLWPSVSNYYLQLSSLEDLQSPVMNLYFLDSGGGSYPEVISSAQVEWFRQTAQELNPHSRYTYFSLF